MGAGTEDALSGKPRVMALPVVETLEADLRADLCKRPFVKRRLSGARLASVGPQPVVKLRVPLGGLRLAAT